MAYKVVAYFLCDETGDSYRKYMIFKSQITEMAFIYKSQLILWPINESHISIAAVDLVI